MEEISVGHRVAGTRSESRYDPSERTLWLGLALRPGTENRGNAMPTDDQAKQHVHELVERLGPAQVAAVLRLLEVMVDPEDEPLSDEDIRAIEASRAHFRENPADGVAFEEFAAECGFTMDQILGHKD